MNRDKKKKIYLLLYNIRSAENVGAIFRTADATGVSKIFLVGYTPAPIDRFSRARKDIAKAALGAEKTIPWEVRKSAPALLRELKRKKIQIIALEQSESATDYKKIRPKKPFCLIVGNEVEGIPKSVLKKADVTAQIEMQGKKESLNVSVAVGVALFRILDI